MLFYYTLTNNGIVSYSIIIFYNFNNRYIEENVVRRQRKVTEFTKHRKDDVRSAPHHSFIQNANPHIHDDGYTLSTTNHPIIVIVFILLAPFLEKSSFIIIFIIDCRAVPYHTIPYTVLLLFIDKKPEISFTSSSQSELSRSLSSRQRIQTYKVSALALELYLSRVREEI